MAVGVALGLTIVAGAIVALQAPINSELGRATASIPAAAINFLIGTLALLLVVALIGQLSDLKGVSEVRWWYVVGGGVCGAIYVATVLITVRTLGAGGATAATVSGQLAMSMVIDRLGILGLEERPLSWQRLAGVALLAVGTYLVVAERSSA